MKILSSTSFSLRSAAVAAILAVGIHCAKGQSNVSLSVDPAATGPTIPADFTGLSFEMQLVLADGAGHHFFRPDNAPLIALFHTLGIRNLRVGGNTTDNPAVKVPTPADIDLLFGFARAAGAKVIFTLRLRQGDPTAAAAVAKYAMAHYASDIICFAIGNEPNVYDKTYPAYVADLKKYIAAVTAPDTAPEAVFCGPSTTPSEAKWARDLAVDFAASGKLKLITQHEYPGGSGSKVTDPAGARNRMLSASWETMYQKIYASFAPMAAAHGLPYRLEETNSFYNGGAKSVSNTFAAGLWALDYLHWWASHNASGLNFHTGDYVAAADNTARCWYASFWTAPDGYAVHPVGYALKAFEIGGHGKSIPVSVTANSDHVNVTAYAVLGSDDSLYVTLVNKEHGSEGRSASITVEAGTYTRGQIMTLTVPSNDVAATEGFTLGGAAIADDGSWNGTWTDLPKSGDQAGVVVSVPAGSAAVVKLATR